MVWSGLGTYVLQKFVRWLIGCWKAVHKAKSPVIGVNCSISILKTYDSVMWPIPGPNWSSAHELTWPAFNPVTDQGPPSTHPEVTTGVRPPSNLIA